MNLRLITTRTAVAGATVALAAGALVGVTTSAANAEVASSTYTCSGGGGAFVSDFAITVDGGLPVPQYWAGANVAAGLLNITVTSPLTAEQAAALGSFGVTGAHSDDFTLDLGATSVSVPVAGGFETTDGTTTWNAAGSNEDFTTPNPGTYDVVLPQSFTMTTEKGEDDFLPLDCVIKDATEPSTLVTGFMLLKQSSATTAPEKATFKKGKAAKLAVSVTSTSLGGAVPGKVIAKEGKKTLDSATLNGKGKATLDLGKKLKVGKHKITVTYKGVPSVGGSSDKSTVTIKK
jgi:hypothetical protein